LAINPAGTLMYMSTDDSSGGISVVDLTTNGSVAFIPFYRPKSIAINPAGTKVYFGQDFGSMTSVIDTATNTVVNSISTGANGDGIAVGPFCPGACSDSNPCTDDHCNPVSGVCSYTNNSASCNDGTFCNGPDTCSGGDCILHAGDPCAGGPECADTCNE